MFLMCSVNSDKEQMRLVAPGNKSITALLGSIRSLFLCGVLTVCLPMLLVALDVSGKAGIAYAAEKSEKKEERKYQNVKARKRQAVGKKCATKLETVQKVLNGEAPPSNEQLQTAEQQLQGYFTSSCTSSYEKSQVYNLLGFVHYSLDNFHKSVVSYRAMVAEPDVDERQKIDTHYTLGQLYMALEDYKNAVVQLELWVQNSAIVSGDGKVLLGQAYYQLERKQEALELVNEAINSVEEKGNIPKENWWVFQKVLYFEKTSDANNYKGVKSYKKVVSILKQLIAHYPKHSYWYELGGIYGQMEESKQRLASLDILHLDKALTKSRDLMSLAYLYLGAGVPNRAAQIIQQGMDQGIIKPTGKNLEILGGALRQAKETQKALEPLKQAAKLSDKGVIWSRLAMVYLDLDENRNAVYAARKALQKGSLKNPSYTHMTLGNALANLHCHRDAIKAFNNAAKYSKSKAAAKQWIAYASSESARREDLIENGAKISGCQLP